MGRPPGAHTSLATFPFTPSLISNSTYNSDKLRILYLLSLLEESEAAGLDGSLVNEHYA